MSAAERALLAELRSAIPPPAAKGRRRRSKSGEAGATARCSFSVPAHLATSFRTLCAAQHKTQRRVLEELIRAYVAQHGHLIP